MLLRSLSKAGHEVVAVENAHRAMDLLHESAFDLVISDLQMPDMGGLDLLHAIGAMDPGLPVLIVSGSGDEMQVKNVLEQGAFDYLRKPLALRTLRETVAAAIEMRRMRADDLESSDPYRSGTRLRQGTDIGGSNETPDWHS